jgi:sugar lactone lactonase YvrE
MNYQRNEEFISLKSIFISTLYFCIISVPLNASALDIHPNAKWKQNGITVAGGGQKGSGINQLNDPWGLYVDDDQTIYVADYANDRIMKWKPGATNGTVVAGGNSQENVAYQLHKPRDVIVDKRSDSLIVCDYGNKRIVRCPRQNSIYGETMISDISCCALTMNENGSLYVVDDEKAEVTQYKVGDTKGTVIAGGNGEGNSFNQLFKPRYIFVDRDYSVYVSDHGNHRVMKWEKDAKQGIVVAGGQGKGNKLAQLYYPEGVVVDQLSTVYVADSWNDRIIRWPKGATRGSVIIGGNGKGAKSNQLNGPDCLSFDRHGNLYVVDWNNHRVQKFNIV